MTNTILITGATSGIGKQLVLDYLAQGKKVYAVGRNQQVLALLQQQGATPVAVDLLCRDAVLQAFTAIEQLDLVICCAGVCQYVDMPDFNSESFMSVINVNLGTLAHTIDGTLPHLQASKGRLVALGSASALVPFPRAEAYASSKSAVHYLMKTLQVSLKPHGIDVTLVVPGFVETPMTKHNTFDMPSLQTVEQASKQIRKGIQKKQEIIEFPNNLVLPLKIFGILPRGIWKAVLQRL